jgi:hypothetical protein
MNQTFKNLASAFGLDLLVVGLIDFLKDQSKEHGKKLVESFILGLGVNDEILFQSACAYAVTELKVTIANINKIIVVIKSYPNSVRERIVEIFGKEEQEITIKDPVIDKTGAVITDKKGNVVFKETKTFANVRGAQTLAILADMTPQEIRAFFKASGATNTAGSKLKATGKKIKKTLQPGINELDDFVTSVGNTINTRTPLRNLFDAIRR